MHTYWQKQGSTPLFPDLVWARPENKLHAGKLLVIGGTAQSFAAPAEAYTASEDAGAGTVRIMLPDSLRRIVRKIFPAAEYAPSTPSGSFGLLSLAELLEASMWADGVIIAADTGNNSETAQLFESFYSKYHGCLTLSGDNINMLTPQSTAFLLNRPNTSFVMTFSELQKLAMHARFTTAFTSQMGLTRFVEVLHDFCEHHATFLAVEYEGVIAVAVDGRISTTQRTDQSITQLSSKIAVWWLQNPAKTFEAFTTAVIN